jgi:hypothetical protein
MVEEVKPDVLVLDLELAGMRGTKVLEQLRGRPASPKVLVLTAYTDGESLRAALDAGAAVVVVSRCPEGRVFPAYGYDGGGRRLRELGVILGGDLPGPKARIKLMVALGVTGEREALRRIFEED